MMLGCLLGVSWGHLGGLLGASGAVWGASWGLLGSLKGSLGAFSEFLGDTYAHTYMHACICCKHAYMHACLYVYDLQADMDTYMDTSVSMCSLQEYM